MFVYCPHCGQAFFTPSFEWVVRCPHCRYLVPLWHFGRMSAPFSLYIVPSTYMTKSHNTSRDKKLEAEAPKMRKCEL